MRDTPHGILSLELRWRDPETGRSAQIAVDTNSAENLDAALAWIKARVQTTLPPSLRAPHVG